MAAINRDTFHVLIIGAGTSGLLIAQGLKKSSISFTIFDSSPPPTDTTRSREWGMTLHWGSAHIAACLPPHLLAHFNEAYADPTAIPGNVSGLPIYNGQTGELLLEMAGDRPQRVSRRKLRALFADGISVSYDMAFKSARVVEDPASEHLGRVEVLFEDGTTVLGDALVGCDGAKSRVRDTLCGTEAAVLTHVPYSMFNFPCRFDAGLAERLRGMNELFVTSMHPEHGSMFWMSIMDVPPNSDPSMWTFQVILSWLDDSVPPGTDLDTYEGRMAFFKSRAEGYAEPWRSVGKTVNPDTQLALDKGAYWASAAKWPNSDGRMTLCGDAAHPMTPHRGQGLNNALLDSANYVAALVRVRNGEVSLPDAVDAYDAEVLERGTREMAISLQQTLLIHDWDTLMQSPMVKMGMRQATDEGVKGEN